MNHDPRDINANKSQYLNLNLSSLEQTVPDKRADKAMIRILALAQCEGQQCATVSAPGIAFWEQLLTHGINSIGLEG